MWLLPVGGAKKGSKNASLIVSLELISRCKIPKDGISGLKGIFSFKDCYVLTNYQLYPLTLSGVFKSIHFTSAGYCYYKNKSEKKVLIL